MQMTDNEMIRHRSKPNTISEAYARIGQGRMHIAYTLQLKPQVPKLPFTGDY